MLGACPYSLEDGVKIVATCQIKKEGICWVWLGMTTATITISIVSAITKLAGVKVGLIGTYRKENGIAALIYDVGQFIAILVVFNFVKQLRHQRRAHQLELSVSVANAAGVGKKREEPLVQAAGYGHYEQPHTLPVYQPTSTISTI
ncbi:unnamed protein product [Orchesella dallaii]|uniref:Uncharacterized protein n=1 Tax=Orchesella dallaii TaxID=48710 RepID=A0ABP1PQE3_9HEXA